MRSMIKAALIVTRGFSGMRLAPYLQQIKTVSTFDQTIQG
jgi:hypothetical protein